MPLFIECTREIYYLVKSSRIIPDQWNIVKIVTIYKRKGCKKILQYYRGIFLAIVISKMFESLIKGRIEPDLQKINILQAGSRSNRGPPDNLFLLRGCVDHHVACKKPCLLLLTTTSKPSIVSGLRTVFCHFRD